MYLSESEKLIRGLRSHLASGQLASNESFWKADGFVGLYGKIPDPASRHLLVNFLVDVDLPELLTEVIRILRRRVYLEERSAARGKRVLSAEKDVKVTRKKKASSMKAGFRDEVPSEV